MGSPSSRQIDAGQVAQRAENVERSDALIVRTKIRVPHLPHGAQARSRLLRKLSRRRNRAGLVVAPPGYGKSTLLAQWASTVDRRIAWVSLDAHDTDPARFWSHAVAALAQAAPGSFSVPLSMFSLDSTAALVSTIVNEMCTLEGGIVLILDDYHEVRSSEVDRSVADLVSHLPAGSMVIISSRHDPGLPMSRWRAADELAEIRQRDLRFNAHDAHGWLEEHSIETSPQIVDACLEVTEGWPAAFPLAVRSALLSEADPLVALTALRATNRHIAEYLREEVFNRNEVEQPVLVVSAFCPQVCGDLVDHALETSNSHEVLHRLERSNVLLERVDESDVWYRLHRLVADHIRLGAERRPEHHKTMIRAAEWLADNGDLRTSLDLLLQAGEYTMACEMINRSWLGYMQSGQLETLRRDLKRIPSDVAAGNRSFLVTDAWLLAYEGRSGEALANLRRAQKCAGGGPLPDGSPSVAATAAVIKSLFAIEGLESAAESAREADALVAPDSAWRPFVDLGIGYSSFMSGELAVARSAFNRVLVSGNAVLRAVAIGWSIVIDVMLGNVEAARARLDDADDAWADDASLAATPAVVVARAAVDCAEGRPTDAAAALEATRKRLGPADPTDKLEIVLWLAEAEASVGRFDRARLCLDEASRILERLGGSGWHTRRIADVEARLGPGAVLTGRDPGLTQREERILQLLSATHLSQREIGRELGVSFNTVKSHVKAVYAKLGATSRDEAAQIARVQGIL